MVGRMASKVVQQSSVHADRAITAMWQHDAVKRGPQGICMESEQAQQQANNPQDASQPLLNPSKQ